MSYISHFGKENFEFDLEISTICKRFVLLSTCFETSLLIAAPAARVVQDMQGKNSTIDLFKVSSYVTVTEIVNCTCLTPNLVVVAK